MNPPPTSSLALLGPFALRIGDRAVTGLPRKAQGLIAYLAMHPGRRVPREAVADLLWTQSGPNQARQSLRQMLVVLRRTPVRDVLGANAEALWIEAGALAVDALTLETALTDGDQAALALCAARCSGALLAELPAVSPGFDEWLLPERARVNGVMARALRRLTECSMTAGDFDSASAAAARLVGMDTLDEASHRLLIDCLARAGRRGEALRQVEACIGILRSDLGVGPDPETIAIADRIRAGAWPPKRPGEPTAADAAPVESQPAKNQSADSPNLASPDAARSQFADAADPAQPVLAEPPRDPRSGAIALPPAPVPATGRRVRWMRGGLAWAAAIIGIIASSVGVFALREPTTHPPGLMVSGFRNVGGVPGLDAAIAGFGDLLRLDLATHHHVRLIEGPVSETPGSAPSRGPASLGSGVRYLLDGTAIIESKNLGIAVRLTDVRDGTELWSSRYNVPIADANRVADEIVVHAARAISQDRDVTVGSPAPPFADAPRAARELVALGHQMDYGVSGTNLPSRQIYRLARGLDQANADVLAHLANADLRSVPFPIPPDQTALNEADAVLRRAMQLDPTNVYALFSACVLRSMQGRVPEAIAFCRRALDLDPRYPGALRELGHALMRTGDAAQAIVAYQASVDAAPFQPFVHNSFKGLGVASLALGRREDAIAWLRKSADADVSNAGNEQIWLVAALELSGRHDEAAKLLGEFMSRRPGIVIDAGYLQLLEAPAYADCRDQVLAALADAGYRR